MSANLKTANSPSSNILAAVAMTADKDRVEALRRVALLLHQNRHAEGEAKTVRAEVMEVLHNQSMARAYQTLRDLGISRDIGELDVMEFAQKSDCALTVCAIALLAHLPVNIAGRLFTADVADLLLVVCRAQNFAWSTVRLLLELRFAGAPSVATERVLCDEYHDMPIAMAQRFGRFLRAHFEVEARSPDYSA